MSAKINTLFKDSSIKYSFLLCVFFLILQIIILAIFYIKLPPLIPFYNSLPWGEARLSISQMIFAIPIGVLLVLIINMYISRMIYLKHTLIARILSVNGFLISLLGCMAIAQIVLLVF